MKVGIKIAKIAKIQDQRSPVDTKERASAIPHCEVATVHVRAAFHFCDPCHIHTISEHDYDAQVIREPRSQHT